MESRPEWIKLRAEIERLKAREVVAEGIIDALLDQQAMPDEGLDQTIKRWRDGKK